MADTDKLAKPLKNVFFNSLRSRYLFGSILLGVLVLNGAFITHNYVSDARQLSIANLEIRNQLLEHSRLARDAVWKSRESLEAFLLEPNDTTYRANVYASISEARTHTKNLSEQPWIYAGEQKNIIAELNNTLLKLEKNADELIETRLDSSKQYPALASAREYMLPNHRVFYTAASLAIDELSEVDEDISNTEAYETFIQARHLWTQMISNFRMYLANRMGSFDQKILPVQEKDTDLLYFELRRQIHKLELMNNTGDLGFQSSESLEDLKASADDWYVGFQEIKRINAADQWRTDSILLKENIHPLLEIIWDLLLSIDIAIESSANEDVGSLSAVTQNQTQLLWSITAAVIFAIIFGFIFLEKLILTPIANVAQALKAKAIGVEGTDIPLTTLHETQDLVDAFTEMDKQVNARQVDLEYQALHDDLTGLPNRTLLLDRLQQAIYTSRREHSNLVLLIMDLDGFKEVNDTVGHHVGDSLLKEVGVRLLITIREMYTVARLGGDEFAILRPDSDELRAKTVATKIRAALEKAFEIDDLRLFISASIGIAAYPEHGARAQTLIQRADVAMYVAKRNRSGHAVYDPKEDQHSVGRLALMSDLRHALDIDALQLHYQPKIDIKENKIVGAEALLRWNHPKFGAIPPDEIIPLAEQTGLIKPLSIWVLNTAVKQAVKWLSKGIDIHIAINLSVYNLQGLEIIDEIKTSLEVNQLPARYITLEITESAMMANPTHAVEVLTQIEKMGIKISIDDFGTGFSSLAYLKQLPVEELKIDKSFVIDMTQDEDDAVIVRSTIDLAHNLGLKVIAEGVENQDILNLLEMLDCDMAQGRFLGAPMATAELENWISEHTLQSKKNNVLKIVK